MFRRRRNNKSSRVSRLVERKSLDVATRLCADECFPSVSILSRC